MSILLESDKYVGEQMCADILVLICIVSVSGPDVGCWWSPGHSAHVHTCPAASPGRRKVLNVGPLSAGDRTVAAERK